MAFRITVTNNQTKPAKLAVFVNPSKLVQANKTIYNDMLPVAWQVLNFGSGGLPIHILYEPDFLAFVAEKRNDNQINAAASQKVTKANEYFEVDPSGPSVSISQARYITAADVAIVNNSGTFQQTGICDLQSTPYVIVDTNDGTASEFVSIFEFAIVEVASNVKQSDSFKADNIGKWWSFKANDVTQGEVDITYDGHVFTSTTPGELHLATERLFAPLVAGQEEAFIKSKTVLLTIGALLTQAAAQTVINKLMQANKASNVINNYNVSYGKYEANNKTVVALYAPITKLWQRQVSGNDPFQYISDAVTAAKLEKGETVDYESF